MPRRRAGTVTHPWQSGTRPRTTHTYHISQGNLCATHELTSKCHTWTCGCPNRTANGMPASTASEARNHGQEEQRDSGLRYCKICKGYHLVSDHLAG